MKKPENQGGMQSEDTEIDDADLPDCVIRNDIAESGATQKRSSFKCKTCDCILNSPSQLLEVTKYPFHHFDLILKVEIDTFFQSLTTQPDKLDCIIKAL